MSQHNVALTCLLLLLSLLLRLFSYMGREAELRYVARIKAKGAPHHAKAGNINSALLKESEGKAEFVLVLDCDMIVHPDFLQNILGHFYKQARFKWLLCGGL
jgi:cellulose synthase (UDP-forming)